jgi:2-polyprenyl-6-methoxyphenol hydroxylase-like FAD-dependent oxidoreductase
MEYDAIVVGARCAGSPTAMLLARKGFRVLLVDRAVFPSDVVNGYYVQQTGVVHLRNWGLLDSLRDSNCPPLLTLTFDFGYFSLHGSAPAADGYGQSEDRLRSKGAGFDDHVVKPVDIHQLALMLQRANR